MERISSAAHGSRTIATQLLVAATLAAILLAGWILLRAGAQTLATSPTESVTAMTIQPPTEPPYYPGRPY
jgi:hypothetical protein